MLTEGFKKNIDEKIDKLCGLSFHTDELKYLSDIPFFKDDFIEYLRLFQLNRNYIKVYIENDQLKIDIEGPWLNTILFEIPVLAIVSESYTEANGVPHANWMQEGRKRLHEKVNYLQNVIQPGQIFTFADFGTRRRAYYHWQEEVLKYLLSHCTDKLIGTSNIHFAMMLGTKPIGTMAHEFVQAHQQLGSRLVDSQKVALQAWADEYRGELGIALSDTMGSDKFLKDFDRFFSLLFDGCRQDSGSPVRWAEKLIAH